MNFFQKNILFLALLTSYPVFAAPVNISKLRIEIADGKQSDFLILKNDSNTEKQAYSINVKQWKQKSNLNDPLNINNASPENILTETEDLAIFPKTLVIGPNEEKVVRILVKNKEAASKNYSYRLSLTEMNKKATEEVENSLNWRLNISLPVFVANKIPNKLTGLPIEYQYNEKENYVLLNNKSDYHIQIKKIISNGNEQSTNFYILPNMVQKISVQNNAKNIVISTDKGDLSIK
jgi:P pilus assembly chaperone PapD